MPNSVQSWAKKFVLGCVVLPPRPEAGLLNLGQFFAHLCTVKFVECDTHQADKTENPSGKVRRLQYILYGGGGS